MKKHNYTSKTNQNQLIVPKDNNFFNWRFKLESEIPRKLHCFENTLKSNELFNKEYR